GELLEGKPHEQFLWGGAGNGPTAPRQSFTRQVFFRAVKQELAFEKCHSESEAHHHAHFELLFTAETMLAVALFELNKEKTSDDEGYTHGKMVRGLFHTRCQVRVKNHKVFSESLLIVTHKCSHLQGLLNYFGRSMI
ncbi:glucose/sorbosone dehydrogenase, partial [Paenibacillus popilliae ATCC 14706]